MLSNEMRKDYILDRWVVIASQRKRRPTDFVKVKPAKIISTCPFCPGNEHMTPPATLVYLGKNGKIIAEKDSDSFRHKNWLVRCFPNLYPSFMPPVDLYRKVNNRKQLKSMEAVGHNEVIVESPIHEEHPSVAPISQIIHVINAYKDRFNDFYSKDYVRYVSIFRNYGVNAGASLSHAHTQIITTPIVPRIIKEEQEKSSMFWKENNKCIFCDIVEYEKSSSRLIWENESFISFAPWASVHPFEFWIFPKRHQRTILDMTQYEVAELAKVLRICFGGLKNLLGDPSYNFGFHMVPDAYYHWHIEVYPKLAVWAGFEKSTGMYINIVSPEEASSSLREAVRKEEMNLHE